MDKQPWMSSTVGRGLENLLHQICGAVQEQSWGEDAATAAAYGIHDLAQDALSALKKSEIHRALRCLDLAAEIARDYEFPVLSQIACEARSELAKQSGCGPGNRDD